MCIKRIALLTALSCLALSARAAGYGENLVSNGGAEASAGVPNTSTSTMLPPAGWTVAGTLTAAQYGGSGGFPTAASPGPTERGANFFAGGRGMGMMGGSVATATQTISLASFLGDIAGGKVAYSFSAWLGGYSNDNDRAEVSLSFLDGTSAVLGNVVLPAVWASDRLVAGSYVTGLWLREAEGFVPAGSASALITLSMTKARGMYNDASADNISLALSAPVPEPETYAMFLAGLGLLGRRLRRHR